MSMYVSQKLLVKHLYLFFLNPLLCTSTNFDLHVRNSFPYCFFNYISCHPTVGNKWAWHFVSGNIYLMMWSFWSLHTALQMLLFPLEVYNPIMTTAVCTQVFTRHFSHTVLFRPSHYTGDAKVERSLMTTRDFVRFVFLDYSYPVFKSRVYQLT